MNLRQFIPAAGLVVTLLITASVHAAPVRVTEWNLEPSAVAGTNGWSPRFQHALIAEAAEALKKINPDVIVLQHAASWESCDELARALQPETYQVAVCSSFREPGTNTPAHRQVAILTKVKPCLAWSQAWQSEGQTQAAPGGFAFAAIRLGDKNVAVFSTQLSTGMAWDAPENRNPAQQTAREGAARQLVRQIAALQTWKTNRLQAALIAGDFNTTPDDAKLAAEKTLSQLEAAGFASVLAGLPAAQRVTSPGNGHRPDATVDYVFVRDAQAVGNPRIFPGALAEHSAVTCDLDLDAPKPVPLPAQVASANAPVKEAAARANATATANTGGSRILWVAAGILAVIVTAAFAVRGLRRKNSSAAETMPQSATKPKTGPSISTTHLEQILIAPAKDSPPFVHIGSAEGATQTQSQTWQPLANAERLPETVRAGVVASVSRWLRERFVRRLMADRTQLIATQQAAALKVLAVDERLAKIERQLQQRNREYENRIGELEQELASAREENRELIRAKIAQIKAEMERERVRE